MLRLNKFSWGIILAIIVTGIPIYLYVTTIIQAPWGKADIDSSVKDLVEAVERATPTLPKIVLGHRFTSHNAMHGSTWKGYFDYEAVVDGTPTKLRITWEEVTGLNTITIIERLNGNSPANTIWSRGNGAPRQ